MSKFKIVYNCSRCGGTACTYIIEHDGKNLKPKVRDDPFMCPQVGCTEGRQAVWKRKKK